jgi:hypothetical protein
MIDLIAADQLRDYMQDFFKPREFEPFGITFYPAGTVGIQVRRRDEIG